MSRTDSQRKRIERIGKQFEANGFETDMPHQHLKEKAKLSKKNYNANRRNIDNAIIEMESVKCLMEYDTEEALVERIRYYMKDFFLRMF